MAAAGWALRLGMASGTASLLCVHAALQGTSIFAVPLFAAVAAVRGYN